ncbi:hypothetical protein niasHT_022969 [Heterodera trifolii]|uniref:Uncharacterized protein n=1 Tax=Heterodera trifolii TaxID=157864 RepID=A0ABD2KQ45_9BILA
MLNKFFFTFSAPLFLLLLFIVEANLDEKYAKACGPLCKSIPIQTCDTVEINVKTKDGTSRHTTRCYCKWDKGYCVPKAPPSEDVATTSTTNSETVIVETTMMDNHKIDGTSRPNTLYYSKSKSNDVATTTTTNSETDFIETKPMDKKKYKKACEPACGSIPIQTCDTVKINVNTKNGISRPNIICYCKWDDGKEYCVPKDPPSNDVVATANSGDQ